MRYRLWNLTFEVTRKCNIRCEHCMRGDAQNIEITREIVNQVLDNNNIEAIDNLLFSGGEPTLNEDIIVYIIDKIIANNIDVKKITMVTNGQIFSARIARAFQKFNAYRNKRLVEVAKRAFADEPETMAEFIKNNYAKNAEISFSNDQFHEEMYEVINEYKEKAPDLRYYLKGPMKEEDIYKTGRSTDGKEFTYTLTPIRYYKKQDSYHTFDYLYVTALGFYEGEGMGSYEDMDRLNMGSVFEKSIEDLLIEYGKPILGTEPISKKLSLHN